MPATVLTLTETTDKTGYVLGVFTDLGLERDFFRPNRFWDSGSAGNLIQDAGWVMEASIYGRSLFIGPA